MVTQCPIRPGSRYTYRFSVAGHGALIIRPRLAAGAYPFPQPDGEAVVLLGEWWDADIVLLERQAFLSGTPIPSADAYTINGKPNRKPS
jgi:laccase